MKGHGQTARCRECNKEFVQWTARQEFCNDSCRGAYHRRKYRQQKVEEAEFQRELRMNGYGTPQERKEAEEALARVVEEHVSKHRLIRRV